MGGITRSKKYLSKLAYEKTVKELKAIEYDRWIEGKDDFF